MKNAKTIQEYIEGFPNDTQKILRKMWGTVLEAAPDAEESMSYGMPAFKVKGKPLCYFAVFKNHIGFYPIPSSIKAFEKDLSKFKKGKGSVQFPLDKPPYQLIKRMVVFRKKELLKSRKSN